MAQYPSAVPNITNPNVGESRANDYVLVGQIADEVEAIATTLGTNPQGDDATVKDRLDNLAVNDLADVTSTSPVDGQTLTYFAAFGWTPQNGRVQHEAQSTAATHQNAGLPQMYYNGTLKQTAPKISAQNSAPSSPNVGDWWMDTT